MSNPFMIKATEEAKTKHQQKGHNIIIPMVKALREATGQCLRDAKENVETLLRGGVVIVDRVDPYWGDRQRTLGTAKKDIKMRSTFFKLDESYQSPNTANAITLTVTQGEFHFILSCLEGRRGILNLLTPGDFGEETPEMVTELIDKLKGQR